MYMRDLLTIDAAPFNGPSRAADRLSQPADVTSAVFAVLDKEQLAWCIPHGYEGLPDAYGSDVDIIVDESVTALHLRGVLLANERAIGARVVRARGYFITLGCSDARGLPAYVTFDFATRYTDGNLLICDGREILAGRRRHGTFWVPAPGKAFALRVLRSVLKDRLDPETCQSLAALYREAPTGSRATLDAFWPSRTADVAQAAETGNWRSLLDRAPLLRSELRKHLALRNPGHAARSWLGTQGARIRRLLRPQGMVVVMLGPDGAGKSSTIDALERAMAPLFSRAEVRGFAPTLRQVLRKTPSSTATPHALKPRSLPVSLLRAGWWTAYGLFSHVSLHLAKARGTLVLHDRHFIDIFVDPVRYRYGGPSWVLPMISALLPRPDVIVLLNGPPEVLQARKRELTVEETARQCRDYLKLVTPMRNSHIADATKPHPQVVRGIADLLTAEMARRAR